MHKRDVHPLLRVQDLSVTFLGRGSQRKAVDKLTFDIHRAECFAMVGESGSGKSVSAQAVMRLLPNTARIEADLLEYEGIDLLGLPESSMEMIRGGGIGAVFQDPMSALNPVTNVGGQIEESIRRSGNLSRRASNSKVLDLLDCVGLPDPRKIYRQYPHELSGGMRQRIMIAMALSRSPRLLIADEPTTALDLVLQAQILELLKKLQKEHEMAVWLITHDFAAVAEMADRILIMKDGLTLESGGSEILRSPKTDYTAKLLDSIPILNLSPRERSVPKPKRPLLQVEDLVLSYDPLPFWPRESRRRTPCVENVSLSIRSGETVAIVGESGSGKSSLARGILNLIRPLSGRILFEGLEVTDCPPRVRHQLGAIMQIIFQDPFASMDPRMYVEDIVLEGVRSQADLSPHREKQMVGDLLTAVGLERSMSDRYPHEFSGGQRQRISIARALATGPKLLICDEPTSALDVTVQAQILKLLEQIQKDRQMAFLFISHDLALVSQVADYVLVMKSGRVVEQGPTSEVLSRPKSVYTQTLLDAMPNLRKGARSNHCEG